MKHLYLTAGAALLVLGANAQFVQQMPSMKKVAGYESLVTERTGGSAVTSRGTGCIFFEDFEGGAIPAGWEIGPQVEQQTDDGAPLGTFVDAWQVGTAAEANNGGFFTGNEADLDTPPGNLFAFANDDGEPCNCDMNNIGLVTPSIDLTGLSGMGLSFRVFHNGDYAPSTANVQVSIDGGTTFTNIYEVAEADVWQSVSLSLSDYEGLPDVRIRFRWDDGGGWGTGMGVDDVCVAELADYDITLNRAYITNATATWDDPDVRNQEYRTMPVEQANPLVFSAAIVNNGGATQTNIVVSAQVSLNGNDVGTFLSDPLASLAPGARDTIVFNIDWTPSEAGTVEIVYTVEGDNEDSNPADNTLTRTMRLTAEGAANEWSAMGQDNRSTTGSFPMGGGQNYAAFGTRIQVTEAGSIAHGIGVQLVNGTTAGATFVVELVELGVDVVAESDLFEVQSWHLFGAGSNTLTYVPFENPVELQPNTQYFTLISNENNDIVRVGVSGNVMQPGGLYAFDNAEQTLFTFIGDDNPAPMIRLYLDAAPVSVTELSNNGISLGAAMPNPFDQNTRIPYSLDEARNVAFDVRDITGKLVWSQDMGRLPAGEHLLELDRMGLAAGTYIYTMTAGADRLSRRMTITR